MAGSKGARWCRRWLGVALVLGGCGGTEPAMPPPPQVEAPAPPGLEPPLVATPDAGTPSDAGEEVSDAGVAAPSPSDGGDPFASIPPVPIPACLSARVPSVDATPCEVRDLRPDGGTSSFTRLDAQGRTLERADYDPDGGIYFRRTHAYVGPHEVRRVEEESGGTLTTTAWTYDGAGRETRWVYRTTVPGAWSLELVTETRYDAHGRIAQRLHQYGGQPDGRTDYDYGAHGWLEREVRRDAQGGTLHETRFTYHPNGRPKRVSYIPYATMGGETEDAYDEAGRLVLHTWCTHKGCFTSTYAYDAKGRQVRYLFDIRTGDSEGTLAVLTRYDAQGRRAVEQLARDVLHYALEARDVRHETRRFLYACEGGALVREELDVDADAVADGIRALERDARGRLVREHFSGVLQTSELAVREYRYDCRSGGS